MRYKVPIVSPILDGIVVTCHIKRAVFNRHLITYDVGCCCGWFVVVVVVVVFVDVVVEVESDGEPL